MKLPNTLTDTPQWILWRAEVRDGKSTKVPCDAFGRPCAVNDPKSWYPYHEAAQIAAETDVSGIGFCFTRDDPFVGIDLDDCLPTLRGDALEILRRFPTYAEISPSGMGIKLIGLGDKGDVIKARTSEVMGFKQMEVYDRDRFFTVTGHQFGVHEEVADVQQSLDWLIDKFLTPEATELSVSVPRALAPAPEGSLRAAARGFQGTDDQALEVMFHFNASGKLHTLFYEGDPDNDASRADASLLEGIAWVVGSDPERIERIFDRSALAQRDKWQRRSDYRERTINFVLGNMTDHYTGGPLRPEGGHAAPTPQPLSEAKPYNIVDIMDIEPEELDWWVPDFVPKGIPVMLSSPGGVVKGLYTLWIAANKIEGPVIYLGSEDNLAILLRPRAEAAGVGGNRFLPLRTVNLDDGTQVPIRFPKHASALEQAIIDTGARMVVIDAGPEHMQEDLEANKVESVRRFMNPLNDICERLNVTIFLILHTNKTQGAQGTDRISGNRAWVDAQRHVLMAAIDDEDDNVRHIQVGKTNITRGRPCWKFNIETKMIRVRNRETGEWTEKETPYLVDDGPSTKDVDELLKLHGSKVQSDDKIDRTILEYIKDGRKDSDDVDLGVGEMMGLAKRTVRNHRMKLNKEGLIRAVPQRSDDGERVKKWQAELTWEGQDYLDNLGIAEEADW